MGPDTLWAALVKSPCIGYSGHYPVYAVGRNTRQGAISATNRLTDALTVLQNPEEKETAEHLLDRVHAALIGAPAP